MELARAWITGSSHWPLFYDRVDVASVKRPMWALSPNAPIASPSAGRFVFPLVAKAAQQLSARFFQPKGGLVIVDAAMHEEPGEEE